MKCLKCGKKLKSGALFCPECGFKISSDSDVNYEDLILDIIYVDGRLSKAKLGGVAIFVVFILSNMIFTFPSMLRVNFLLFLLAVVAVFLIGLFYYAVCRGIGFVVRKFMS